MNFKNKSEYHDLKKDFLDYCKNLEVNYVLNHLISSFQLNEVLHDVKDHVEEDLISAFSTFQSQLLIQKEKIKHFLSLLSRNFTC